MSACQWWSRRDKRTAKRAGHWWLSQPLYRGEAYGSRCSFGAFRPDNVLYDGTTPFEYVEIVRGRKAAPKWIVAILTERAYLAAKEQK